MGDQSNAGTRVLGPRRTVRGNKDALENIIGQGLHDGAQCYVIEAQANYRYVAQSQLAPDGELVVATVGNRGRWVRESGLVGMALLEDGGASATSSDAVAVFQSYTHFKLVQFALDDGPERSVIYTGAVPRLALLFASADLRFDRGSAELFIRVDSSARVASASSLVNAGYAACSGAAQLMPGDKLSLCLRATAGATGKGSLRIVLA
jgi:hypothetical protein